MKSSTMLANRQMQSSLSTVPKPYTIKLYRLHRFHTPMRREERPTKTCLSFVPVYNTNISGVYNTNISGPNMSMFGFCDTIPVTMATYRYVNRR